MKIYQIPVRNPLRNYMYLLACEKTQQAVAIDPLDHQLCLETAQREDLKITAVVNTHHHSDHIDGNGPVIAATGARLYCHRDAMKSIPNVDVGLNKGDRLDVGELCFLVMDTPGHTMSHICLFFAGSEIEEPALFCGDTLFNAGVGRCDFGGAPDVLYDTFVEQFFPLDDHVRVFPGHDYIENNLKFTLDREANNTTAQDLLNQFDNGLDAESYVTNIGLERQINVFFRLGSSEVRQGVATDDDKSTFIALRRLRDSW